MPIPRSFSILTKSDRKKINRLKRENKKEFSKQQDQKKVPGIANLKKMEKLLSEL